MGVIVVFSSFCDIQCHDWMWSLECLDCFVDFVNPFYLCLELAFCF